MTRRKDDVRHFGENMMELGFSAEPQGHFTADSAEAQTRLQALEAAEAAGPVAMLDLALQLGEEELRALTAGEVEAAEMYYELRARLLNSAQGRPSPEDKPHIVARRRAMGYLQDRLTAAGRELRAQMVARMNRSRAEARRLRGYRQSVGQALAVG